MADTGKIVSLIKSLAKVDPETVKQDVEDWLEEHPEATTTVEDGSISRAKLDADLKGKTDDVALLKSAVSSEYTPFADGTISETMTGNPTRKYIPGTFAQGKAFKVTVDFTSISFTKFRIYLATAQSVSYQTDYLGEFTVATGDTLSVPFVPTVDASFLSLVCYASSGTQTFDYEISNIREIPLVDATLQNAGSAADAKAVGDSLLIERLKIRDKFTSSASETVHHFLPLTMKAGQTYTFIVDVISVNLDSNHIKLRSATAAANSSANYKETILDSAAMVDGAKLSFTFTPQYDTLYLAVTYYCLAGDHDFRFAVIDTPVRVKKYAETEIVSKDFNQKIASNTHFRFNASKSGDGALYRMEIDFTQTHTSAINFRYYNSDGQTTLCGVKPMDGEKIVAVFDSNDFLEKINDIGFQYVAASSEDNEIFGVKITKIIPDKMIGVLTDRADRNRHRGRMEFGAHQGAKNYAPIGSLAAYKKAGELGFDWAWIAQIKHSADGTLWVLHDDTMNGITDYSGSKTIFQMTDEEITACKCDVTSNNYNLSDFAQEDLRIPTLEEVIQICLTYGMKLYFRADDLPYEYDGEGGIWDKFVGLIKGYGIKNDECAYSIYSNVGRLNLLRQKLGNDIEISPFFSATSTPQDYITWLDENNVTNRSCIIPIQTVVDVDGVKLLHQNNVKCYLYDADNKVFTREQILQFASWGVDAVQGGFWYWLPV